MSDQRSEAIVLDLDERGLALTREVHEELGDETKVRYYSEGRLEYIEPHP